MVMDDIKELVNNTETLPVDAKLDYLAPDAPAASVQQLPGSRWAKRYVSGSGVREIPFAVRLRTAGTDTAGRIEATTALIALADALEGADAEDLPDDVIGVTGEDTPSLIERSDNGTEVWYATYVVESQS